MARSTAAMVEVGAEPPDWRRRPWFLRFFVTVTGAAVMAIEFGSQRLLAPFFGSSQLVWGLVIGLILLALSIGYHWGGRLADRRPTPRRLGMIVVAAGVWTAGIPTVSRPLLTLTVHGLLATPAGLVVGALAGVVGLVLPPVLALGMVSPFAVRLALDRVEGAGATAGGLYAFATLGSLMGTFVPVFVTIPDFGVRATLWGSAAALLGVGAVTLGKATSALLLLVPAGLARVSPPLLKPVAGLVTEVETPYQFAEVYRLRGGRLALSVNDGAGIQSVYTPRRLTGLYMTPLPCCRSGFRRIVP